MRDLGIWGVRYNHMLGSGIKEFSMQYRVFMILSLLLPLQPTIGQSGDAKVSTMKGCLVSCVNNSRITTGLVKLKGTRLASIPDSLGQYIIREIPPGKHSVQVMGFGYNNIDTVVSFLAGDTASLDFALKTKCSHDAKVATIDIRENQIKLLLAGGIAPGASTSEDEAFEKKYDIQYFDFGCVPPADACIEEYNKVMFKYLDQKFGRTWRKEVRRDVCFLSE